MLLLVLLLGAATVCCYLMLLPMLLLSVSECKCTKSRMPGRRCTTACEIPMHLQTCPLKDPRMKSMKGRSVHTSEATCKSDRSTWVPPVYMRACPKKLNPNRRTWNTQWTRCYQKVNSSTNDVEHSSESRGKAIAAETQRPTAQK